jgi:pimeloyl-ACP methyl ester carboxylesterase
MSNPPSQHDPRPSRRTLNTTLLAGLGAPLLPPSNLLAQGAASAPRPCRGPKPLPLILTHGRPGSTFEFLEAIGPLSNPASYGGSPDDAFDVVVPSLPGFGFSSKPIAKPIGRATVAPLWNRLMTEVLGYARYGAQAVTCRARRRHYSPDNSQPRLSGYI